MEKEILFLSNYCGHCKELFALLSKHNIQTKFHVISIDDENITVPPYIDRVPTLINTQKNILVGDNLFSYINTIIQKIIEENNKKNNASNVVSEYSQELNNGFSDNYSYLDTENKPHAHTFSYLDHSNFKIETPDDSNFSTSKKRGDSSDYEKLLAEREREVYSKGIQRI
jgi:hypothetical protein